MDSKTRLHYLVAAMMLMPLSVNANAWKCEHNGMVREVQVEYLSDGKVPCNVIYDKPTEGVETKVLWFADKQEGYCEEKAQGFVNKLESWGWTCTPFEEAPVVEQAVEEQPVEETVAEEPEREEVKLEEPTKPVTVTEEDFE
jgi:hypothetical protein